MDRDQSIVRVIECSPIIPAPPLLPPFAISLLSGWLVVGEGEREREREREKER